MCSGIKKVFRAVVGLVRKAWNVIRKYLVYIVLLVAIFYPFIYPMLVSYLPAALVAVLPAAGVWATMTLEALAIRGLIGLAIAFFLDSETAREVVEKIAEVAGDVAGAVVDIGGAVVGGALEGALSSPIAWVAIGLFAFFLLRREKSEEEQPEPPRSDVTYSA